MAKSIPQYQLNYWHDYLAGKMHNAVQDIQDKTAKPLNEWLLEKLVQTNQPLWRQYMDAKSALASWNRAARALKKARAALANDELPAELVKADIFSVSFSWHDDPEEKTIAVGEETQRLLAFFKMDLPTALIKCPATEKLGIKRAALIKAQEDLRHRLMMLTSPDALAAFADEMLKKFDL